MKKPFVITLVALILLLILGIWTGWKDNGPRKIDVNSLPSRLDE